MRHYCFAVFIGLLIANTSFGIDKDFLKKPNLRVLDIGNSYTFQATQFLKQITDASGSDVSDMCLYRATVGNGRFRDWYYIIDDLSQSTVKYTITPTQTAPGAARARKATTQVSPEETMAS